MEYNSDRRYTPHLMVMNIAKLVFVFCLALGFILILKPAIALSQGAGGSMGLPESLGDLKTILDRVLAAFPGAFKAALKEAMAVWQKLYQWFNTWWQGHFTFNFDIWVKLTWQRLVKLLFNREAIFNEEFPKEKNEMKTSINKDLSGYWNYLWEKFKKIIE